MDFAQSIRQFTPQPLPHQLIMSLLKDYKQPNDKVHALIKSGVLLPVKRGLYIGGPSLNDKRPEPFLLANHIFGPSYVSSDSALAYFDLIPERVYTTTSVTTKASRSYATFMGEFSYTKLPLPFYSCGITRVNLARQQYAMVASPEKALMDKIVLTKGVVFRSKRDVLGYLYDDLRFDVDASKAFDTEMMNTWLQRAPKKSSLSLLIQTIKQL